MIINKDDFVIFFVAGHDRISEDRQYRHNGAAMHSGDTFYEGIPNREIVNYAIDITKRLMIPHVVISNPNFGPDLQKRVDLINEYSQFFKQSLTIDTHCNAGKGEGIEAYTTKGETLSDVACTFFYKLAVKLTNYRLRREYYNDTDPDKEKNYFVIYTVYGPAFLPEFLFFDMLKQAKDLKKEEVLRLFAHILVLTALYFNAYLVKNCKL